jgi:YbbR domain-containing protein
MMDRLLENDTVLKILSVLVAIFLWLQVTGVTTHPVQKESIFGPIPLQWNLPKGSPLTVMTVHPTSVYVELQGPSKTLAGVKDGNLTAFVNLSDITRAGSYTLRLSAAVPTGTRTVSILPAQATVSLDQIGSRRMAITVSPKGTVPAKYEVTSMVPSVGEATLSGPTGDLDHVKRVVAAVSLSGQTSNFRSQSLLVPVNAAGTPVPHVDVNPPMVDVAAAIRQKPPQVTVGVVVRVSGHPASGYSISSIVVNPDRISVTGSASALRRLSSVYTSPVDVSGVSAAVSGAVPVVLPTGVSAVSGSNLVQVTVNISPSSP